MRTYLDLRIKDQETIRKSLELAVEYGYPRAKALLKRWLLEITAHDEPLEIIGDDDEEDYDSD